MVCTDTLVEVECEVLGVNIDWPGPSGAFELLTEVETFSCWMVAVPRNLLTYSAVKLSMTPKQVTACELAMKVSQCCG